MLRARGFILLLALSAVVGFGPSAYHAYSSRPATGFSSLGNYYATTSGPTSLTIRMPKADGEMRAWSSWGYDIWNEGGVDTGPTSSWVSTDSLYDPPYNVPRDAKAVRVHVKAKVAIVSWADNHVAGAVQVSAKPGGSLGLTNELVHAYAEKPADQVGVTPYDLAHVESDIVLGKDGTIDIFRDVSILGDYAQVDVIVYLSGYWR